jgi:hypothetical protein
VDGLAVECTEWDGLLEAADVNELELAAADAGVAWMGDRESVPYGRRREFFARSQDFEECVLVKRDSASGQGGQRAKRGVPIQSLDVVVNSSLA